MMLLKGIKNYTGIGETPEKSKRDELKDLRCSLKKINAKKERIATEKEELRIEQKNIEMFEGKIREKVRGISHYAEKVKLKDGIISIWFNNRAQVTAKDIIEIEERFNFKFEKITMEEVDSFHHSYHYISLIFSIVCCEEEK